MSWFRKILLVDELLRKVQPPPLAQVVAEEMDEALREAQQAAQVIENHRFLRHMALSRMEALENWHHQRDVKGE